MHIKMRCVSLLRNIIRIINDRRLNYETNTVFTLAVGLTANMTVMAGMSTSKVRKETRFLTDKMAYELQQDSAVFSDCFQSICTPLLDTGGSVLACLAAHQPAGQSTPAASAPHAACVSCLLFASSLISFRKSCPFGTRGV